MATLAELQNNVTNSKNKLDELIPKWNSAIQLYNNYRDTYIVHLFCVQQDNSANVITAGMDWDAIAISVGAYDDIKKIKKNADLRLLSCPGAKTIYGNTPATENEAGAIQFVEPFLISFKALYNDFMAKYGTYINDLEALKQSPEYAGSVLAQQATAEATAQIKKAWTYALIGLGVVGVLVFIWWKWIRK